MHKTFSTIFQVIWYFFLFIFGGLFTHFNSVNNDLSILNSDEFIPKWCKYLNSMNTIELIAITLFIVLGLLSILFWYLKRKYADYDEKTKLLIRIAKELHISDDEIDIALGINTKEKRKATGERLKDSTVKTTKIE